MKEKSLQNDMHCFWKVLQTTNSYKFENKPGCYSSSLKISQNQNMAVLPYVYHRELFRDRVRNEQELINVDNNNNIIIIIIIIIIILYSF